MRVVVAGGSGFVGRRLVAALLDSGHDVLTLSRSGSDAGVPASSGSLGHVGLDVADTGAVAHALTEHGAEAAYYLVHSLGEGEFRERDRKLAESFATAAKRARVGRIVYLGGLGSAPGSEHLRSRQEVGETLRRLGPGVVELRAAVVLGSGSASFEILRYLTERLPLMVCPRWVATRNEPIAASDLVAFLLRALEVEPGVYEVGCGEVTSYREMIQAYARVRGLRRRLILDIPYLTPRLSSYWVFFVTPVDRRTTARLIDSLGTEVVAADAGRTAEVFGITPVPIDEALRQALDEQAAEIDGDLLTRRTGLSDGVYTARVAVPVPAGCEERLDDDLGAIGGSYSWYGLEWGWRLRQAVGRPFGERLALSRPSEGAGGVGTGDEVDWWTVVERSSGRLVLRGLGWFPGDAWLGYELTDGQLVEVGALRPRGVLGFLYWNLLVPVHHRVFARMAEHRVERATPP